jgi:diketogulonate reductase-like aldo/keto reductase
VALLAATPAIARSEARQPLPGRLIPGTNESLPIIGMGNSNAFRQGDKEASWNVIQIFQDHGSRYIDVGGPSRFVVADIVREHDLADSVFLGSYFSGENDMQSHDEAKRLMELTGKSVLDLMHNYPEDAVPYWDTFRRWKDEGLTRYIGVARHRSEYYDMMMGLMETGTVDFLQVNYSLLETEAEERILPLAMEKRIAVTINRPFINGQYFSIVRGHELPAWAADFDCSSWAQFSLKFILSHPAVNCVLTETANPAHAKDNIAAGFGRLPDEAQRQQMLAHIRSLA